jgi:ParB-like nuclease domain
MSKTHFFHDKLTLPEDTPLDKIEVRAEHRALDEKAVASLVVSLHKEGLQSRIILSSRLGPERRVLIAGRHRLEAARRNFWKTIPAIVIEMTELDEQLCEISENLARAELSVLERAEQTAKWLKLTGQAIAEEVSSQPETKVGRPESGINAAARAVGLTKSEAHRVVTIANLPSEVKEAARKLGLSNNQTALLQAAEHQHETPDIQIDVLKAIATKKRKAREATAHKNFTSPSPAMIRARTIQAMSSKDIFIEPGKVCGISIHFGLGPTINLPKALWIEHAKKILATLETMEETVIVAEPVKATWTRPVPRAKKVEPVIDPATAKANALLNDHVRANKATNASQGTKGTLAAAITDDELSWINSGTGKLAKSLKTSLATGEEFTPSQLADKLSALCDAMKAVVVVNGPVNIAA